MIHSKPQPFMMATATATSQCFPGGWMALRAESIIRVMIDLLNVVR
jgi:hypothetical protein